MPRDATASSRACRITLRSSPKSLHRSLNEIVRTSELLAASPALFAFATVKTGIDGVQIMQSRDA